jgi:hypothetical protein
VLEVSNAHIAVVTKESSNMPGLVTVIDMKDSLSTGIKGIADRALAFLKREYFIVFTSGQSVIRLAVVFLMALWVCYAMLFLVCCALLKVLQTPYFVARETARLAVYLVTMRRSFRSVVFGQRFGHPAFRTGF